MSEYYLGQYLDLFLPSEIFSGNIWCVFPLSTIKDTIWISFTLCVLFGFCLLSEYYLGHNLDLFYLLYQTFLFSEGIYKIYILPKRWVESINKSGRSSVQSHVPPCIWGHHHQQLRFRRTAFLWWSSYCHMMTIISSFVTGRKLLIHNLYLQAEVWL